MELLPYKVLEVLPSVKETQDWHLTKTHVPDLWLKAAGEGVRVGVADTGTSLNHPDLIHSYNNIKDFTGDGPDDVQGHGSHCSGIIAARANDLGVVGVAPSCRIYHAKVLGNRGQGNDRDIVAGIEWLIAQGCTIISMSLGSQDESPYISQCISAHKGIDFVVAAGNSGPSNNTQEWPSRHPNAIAVAAVDSDGRIASFSSRGPHIAIAAPGVDILSTFKGKEYARLSGTSMATPFVAGCLALARSAGDQRPAKEILKGAAIPQQDASAYGWGLINPTDLINVSNPKPNPDTYTIAFNNGMKLIVPKGVKIINDNDPTFTPG